MQFDYHNRYFKAVANTDNGETGEDTIFHYRQQGDIVWATYQGGAVIFGTLLARMDNDGALDMRYQQLNVKGEFRAGICRSVPTELADGRYRLHESWKWINGDESSGASVIEEVIS